MVRASLTVGLCFMMFAGTACGAGEAARRHATERALSDLRARAAFDFHCGAEQIEIQQLGNFSMQGASGCGRRATYVYTPRGAWLMNTDEKSVADAPK